ncbi:hypothetical protein HA466_0044650 [Hirschfeldia incana]|nr:hypothetical protein HA466_0044650 [Hirschfeldia incana]
MATSLQRWLSYSGLPPQKTPINSRHRRKRSRHVSRSQNLRKGESFSSFLLLSASVMLPADDVQKEAKELSRIRDYIFNELTKKYRTAYRKDIQRFEQIETVRLRRSYIEHGLIDKNVRPPHIKGDTPPQDETSGLSKSAFFNIL